MHDVSVCACVVVLRTWPMWNYMLHIAELGISVCHNLLDPVII